MVLAGGQLSASTVATVVGAINAMPAKASTDLQNRVYAALTWAGSARRHRSK